MLEKNQNVMFYICQADIITNQIMENINNFINNNLLMEYSPEDQRLLLNIVQNEAISLAITPAALLKQKLTQKLHMVLALNPHSPDFRLYVREYPSIT